MAVGWMLCLSSLKIDYKAYEAMIDGVSNEPGKKVRGMGGLETNITMEIAQLLLSLLHAWGMDPDLDRVCEGKLGLLRPMVPVSFGVLSKGG
uniref:Uncharacterized protein n=1 Tax=Timema poppense TaxID=170557 RepID=A0A7R9CHP4_TIMPO|nr:unnamed protein product [Timema poppensis]